MYLVVSVTITFLRFKVIIVLASIYTAEEANACSVWPSPEQLKGRIIIRVGSFLLP